MLLRIINAIERAHRRKKEKKAYEKWAAEQKAKGLPYDQKAYKASLRKQFLGLNRNK